MKWQFSSMGDCRRASDSDGIGISRWPSVLDHVDCFMGVISLETLLDALVMRQRAWLTKRKSVNLFI